MTMPLTIGRETNSYRQGLVLGLTMAETMLLLVFCLLLAAAAVFARERQKLDESAALAQRLQEENDRLTESRRASLKKDIPDDWQHLVLWFEKKGVSPKDAQNAVDTMAEIDKALRADGHEVAPAQYPGLIQESVQAQVTGALPRSKGAHDWPPMIPLSEAKGYHFETGSAALSPSFRVALSDEVPEKILKIVEEYKVNVIEVIGHTDEQPIAEWPSNLDKLLVPLLRGRGAAGELVPADNAGLGLARAVSVANVLRNNPRLSGYTILPYSAAQLIDLGDVLSDGASAGDVKERRRIEIRLRRADSSSAAVKQTAVKPQSSGPSARIIAGRASIIDADTIEIHGERIRIWGIDSVEGRQTCRIGGQVWRCAQDAAFAIDAHLQGQTVSCTERDRDQYGRVVAMCTVRGGDVGAWLVRQGFALDYPRYSGDRYASEQAKAKAEKRGLWRGEFELPWEWRRKRGQ